MIPYLLPSEPFPHPCNALREPDGLLCAGADLSTGRLLQAYRLGIFPWYETGQPILWWSPDPRCILLPHAVHVSRSMRRLLRQQPFAFSFDRAFSAVIDGCAAPRATASGTWITAAMRSAYIRLHHEGHAHSIEVWQQQRLVGGLYGLAIGAVFFAESMFSRVANASKAALVSLAQQLTAWGYQMVDCQVASAHLLTLGATPVPREDFLRILHNAVNERPEHRWSVTLSHLPQRV